MYGKPRTLAQRKARHKKLYGTTKVPKLGTGRRFRAVAKKTGSKALAAYIGRRKYGAKRMAQMAATGRRRAARKRKR